MSRDRQEHDYAPAPRNDHHYDRHSRASRSSKSTSRSRSRSRQTHGLEDSGDYLHSSRPPMEQVDHEDDLRHIIDNQIQCSVCASPDRPQLFYGISVCRNCLQFYFRMRYSKHGIPTHCKFTRGTPCIIHFLNKDKFCSYCHLEQLYRAGFHQLLIRGKKIIPTPPKKHFKSPDKPYPAKKNHSPKNVFKRLDNGCKNPSGEPPARAGPNKTNLVPVQKDVTRPSASSSKRTINLDRAGPKESSDREKRPRVSESSEKHTSNGSEQERTVSDSGTSNPQCGSSIMSTSSCDRPSSKNDVQQPSDTSAPHALPAVPDELPPVAEKLPSEPQKAPPDSEKPAPVLENPAPIVEKVPIVAEKLPVTAAKLPPVPRKLPATCQTSSISSDPIRCRVCGTKNEQEILALYKLGEQPIMSCESCRIFIRKAKKDGHEYLERGCYFRTGKCQVNDVNRKNCKYCRLQKCLRLNLLVLPPKRPDEEPAGAQQASRSSSPQSHYEQRIPPVPGADSAPPPAAPSSQTPASNNEGSSITTVPREHCRVCGSLDQVAKAYNVVMCHACMKFYGGFRTGNAKLPKDCVQGSGDCIITLDTRINCRACRLMKCFQAGCPMLVEQGDLRESNEPLVSIREQVNPTRTCAPVRSHAEECSVCRSTMKVELSYNAILCRPCRIFYYDRKKGNLKLPTLANCPNQQGKCTITEATRRNCRFCRLKRLYSVGCPRLIPKREAEYHLLREKFKKKFATIKRKVTPVYNERIISNILSMKQSANMNKSYKSTKCEVCGDHQGISKVSLSEIHILLCQDCHEFRKKINKIRDQVKKDKCSLKQFNCDINVQTRANCEYCRARKLARVVKSKRKAREARLQEASASSKAENVAQQSTASSATITLVDLTDQHSSSSSGPDQQANSVKPGCSVCKDSENCVNFRGFIVCIACRAFYNRMSRPSKKPVTCATGQGDCQVTKRTRMMCLYCRCKALISAGLEIDPSKMGKKKKRPKHKTYRPKECPHPLSTFISDTEEVRPSVIQLPNDRAPKADAPVDEQQTVRTTLSEPAEHGNHESDQRDTNTMDGMQSNEENMQACKKSPLTIVGGEHELSTEDPASAGDLNKPSESHHNPSSRVDLTELAQLIIQRFGDYQQQQSNKSTIPTTSQSSFQADNSDLTNAMTDKMSPPLQQTTPDPLLASHFYGDLQAFRSGSSTKKDSSKERPIAVARNEHLQKKLLPTPNLGRDSGLDVKHNDDDDDNSNTSHVRTITNFNFRLETNSQPQQEGAISATRVHNLDLTLQSYEAVIESRPSNNQQASNKEAVPGAGGALRHPESVIGPGEDCDPDYVHEPEVIEIDCDA